MNVSIEMILAFAAREGVSEADSRAAIAGRTGVRALTDNLVYRAIAVFGGDCDHRDVAVARRVIRDGSEAVVPSNGEHPDAVSRLLTEAGIPHTREKRMFGPFWPNPTGYPGELISRA
jgi:hypothetical protein